MKTMKYLSGMFLMSALLAGVGGCKNEGVSYLRPNTADETITLAASVDKVTLTPNNLLDNVLTFTWTEAREMSDDYLVSYVTKLDVQGNGFANAIREQENDGVFSKTYTAAQLQNILIEKWGRPSTRPTTVEFEILAKWEGGTKYVMPEVRKVSVEIQPFRPATFDMDRMYVSGSAVPGSRGQFALTPESEFIYVWTGNLIPGELSVDLDFEGETSYLYPVDFDGKLLNDASEGVDVNGDVLESWTVTEAGEYRVIVDVKDKTFRVFTPGNIPQPAVVEWTNGGAPEITTVTTLWLYGESTGWSWAQNTGDFKPSLIDPQVLYYQGAAKNGRTKFGIRNINASFVYGPVNTTGVKIDNVPITMGTEHDLGSGDAGYQRDTYFGLPSGTNYIVIDLRRMKIIVEKR